jgi:hypothetical protein
MSHVSAAPPAAPAMRWLTAAQWYAVAAGLFLAVRSLTTLLASPSFALPGDGERGVFQLVIACALGAAVVRASLTGRIVLAVGLIYVVVTVLGDPGHSVLGIFPVDGRDKIVHPLLAVLAFVTLAIPRWRGHRAASR